MSKSSMLDFIFPWKRNKSSIIRSSSAGGRPSYPYPRSHTPMMIIPSSRPVMEQEPSTRTTSFGNRRLREQERERPRRRPPLNTAIPTIPESKSNESIMSHISRISLNNNEKTETSGTTDMGCVIIENPAAVAGIPRLSTSAVGSTNVDVANNNSISSSSSGGSGGRRREKRSAKMGTTKPSPVERASAPSTAPLSPLMSVAHSVRNKLSKLTKIRSRSNSTERSNSIKTSQSFSGIRPAKSKLPPKRIDENANRVIKSNSMDVKLSSDIPSTSKVVIPRNPEPLYSDDEQHEIYRPTELERVQEKLESMETIADLDTVEVKSEVEPKKEIEENAQEVASSSQLASIPLTEIMESAESKYIPDDTIAENRSSPVIQEVVHTVIKAEKRSQIPLSVSFSMEPICVSPSPVVESPGDKENSISSSIGKSECPSNAIQTADSKTTTTTTRQVLQATNRQDGGTTMTTTTTITTTTTTTIIEDDSKKLEEVPEANEEEPPVPPPTKVSKMKSERMKRSKSEEQPAQRRYVLTVQTPEPLRRHKTFVIGESEPTSETERLILESRKKTKKSKPSRSKSAEDTKSPERFVLVAKGPLPISKTHQTFVIGEGEPSIKPITKRKSLEKRNKEKMKKSVSVDDAKSPERYVMLVKTPLTARKHQTFIVGSVEPTSEVEASTSSKLVTSLEEVKSLQNSKKVRSPSPEEAKSPERYVMFAKTPLTARKNQTFVVGDAEPGVEPQVDVETIAKLEEVKSPKKAKKVRSSSPEEAKSPERYVMIAKTPLTARKNQTFVVGDADPGVEPQVDVEAITKLEEVKSPKKIKKVRSPSPEEAKSPERYVMIAKTPLTARKNQTFVIGDAEHEVEPQVDVETITKLEEVKSPKKAKKVRSQSPEEAKSPERYVMIAKTPLTARKNQTFVVGEAEPEVEPQVHVETITKLEEVKSPKKAKKVRSQSPEEAKSPERYVMIAKTPLTARKNQTFVIGDAEHEVEPQVDVETITKLEEVKSPKKAKKVRSQSPEEAKSPERYVMIAKTPLTARKNQTFVVGEAEPEVEPQVHVETITKLEEVKSPKKAKKVRSQSPEEAKSPERYVMIAKTPLTARKNQTFVIGDAKHDVEPQVDVETITKLEEVKSPKKAKKVRSPSPEEAKSPERYVMIAKTPLAARKNQTFVIDDSKAETVHQMQNITEIDLKDENSSKPSEIDQPQTSIEDKSSEICSMVTSTIVTSEAKHVFEVKEASPENQYFESQIDKEIVQKVEHTILTESTSASHPSAIIEAIQDYHVTKSSEGPAQDSSRSNLDESAEIKHENVSEKFEELRSELVDNSGRTEKCVMLTTITTRTSQPEQDLVEKEFETKEDFATDVSISTELKGISSPTKAKKVRSPSPEEAKSPERYVMIAKTPLTARKNQTFVIGDAEHEVEPQVDVETITKLEEVKSPKKAKKVRSQSPEEAKSPERYVMIAKTPLTARKNQTFVIGDAEHEVEPQVDVETITKLEEVKSPKKAKKVRSQSPEEAKSPERYVMIAKTPLTARKNQTFVIGDAEHEVEPQVDVETITKLEEVKSPKKAKKIRSPSPEEAKSPERYVLIAKTPLTARKNQTFVIGDAEHEVEPQVDVETITKLEEVKSPKKAKKVRSPSPEEAKSPERYVMIAKTPLTARKNQTFVIGDAEHEVEPQVHVETITKLEEVKSPKKAKKIRSPSPEEAKSPERYVLIAKTPLTARKNQTFVIGDAEHEVEPQVDVETITKLEEVKSPKKAKKVRSPSPEEAKSPERFIMITKTPLTSRKNQAFVIEDAQSKAVSEEIQMTKTTTLTSAVPITKKKKEKKIIRQHSTPEQDTSCERFVLITKTPQFIRRHHTFMIGERPPSPDVPWIEEDEDTEPIATVGPYAFKKRTKSEEPRKRKAMFEDEKPPERFILTSRTPLALRKFKTFVVDTKPSEMITSTSETTHLNRGREVSRVKREKLKTSSTFTAADRTKSPYEDEPKSPERFIMTATTPYTTKKFSKFTVEEKVTSPESVMSDDDDELPRVPMKPSDMYVLTATTPLMPRRGPRGDVILDDDELQTSSGIISAAGGRDFSYSPERPTLFVMGRRSPAPHSADRRTDLHLEGIRENSQSDRAERKMSMISGEMTSPEEEIPMDTQQTPSEDEACEIALPLRSIHVRTSPILEEPIIQPEIRPPVFCAPSPPRAVTTSKSTSPIKSPESRPEISTSTSCSFTKEMTKRERKVAAKADKKREEKEKPAKAPLATRSLRSAGRMFAPSFFRRSERRHQKPTAPPKAMSFPSNRPAMDISFNSPRAPLAEFESTVVENSPLVENHPLTFDKWNHSPWSRRRFADQAFAQTIKEESDGNGNPNSNSYDRSVASPLLGRHHDHDKGLIDDEILDQPMLVGDTFSHSESMDRLSAVRHMDAFEAEKATLISIDRSLAEELDPTSSSNVPHQQIQNLPALASMTVSSPLASSAPPSRRPDNGNTRPAPSVVTPFFTSAVQSNSIHTTLDEGLNEVNDIKAQLQQLRQIVEQESSRAVDETKEALIRENDALRRQLIEQDNIITALKQQIAVLKAT